MRAQVIVLSVVKTELLYSRTILISSKTIEKRQVYHFSLQTQLLMEIMGFVVANTFRSVMFAGHKTKPAQHWDNWDSTWRYPRHVPKPGRFTHHCNVS